MRERNFHGMTHQEREEMDRDEPLCDCGTCKWCDAYHSSEHDHEGEDFVCSTCNGAGCFRCEE